MTGLRPRWNKVLADLWSNKVRSLLVIASITVGVFAAGLIISIYFILTEDMRSSYKEISPANIIVSASDFNSDFSDTIKRMPEISTAESAKVFTLQVRLPSEVTGGEEGWTTITVKAIPDFAKSNINQVIPITGEWPPKDKEIVFDQHKFGDIHSSVGQSIEVKLPDGKLKKLPITGLVMDEAIGAGTGGGFFAANLQGYITFDTLEWLGQTEKANMLYARVAENGEDTNHIFDVARLVSNKFEDNNQSINYFSVRKTSEHPNVTYIEAMSGILIILGLLVVFLSGFLITNTLSALFSQQIEQIGIIKTLGGRSTQIMFIYMTLILVYSVISLLIALPLSGRVAYGLLEFFAAQINFVPMGFREVPISVVAQIFIAIIVPQVAGFIPILHGSRITVQDAMNGPSNKTQENQGNWFDRFSKRLQGLSRPLLISLRNTFRKKSRLILTLTTLTLGGAMFIATFNVQTSMNAFISKLSRYFTADVSLDFSQPHHIEEINNMLVNYPNIKMVEGWAGARAELMLEGDKPGESVNLLAPPVYSQLIQPMILEGRWLVAGDQNAIVLNDNFKSRFPDLKVGDTIRLRVYGKKVDCVVIGFFQFAGKTSGFMGYTSYDYLSQITHTELQAASFRIMSGTPHMTLQQQKNLGHELEAYFNNAGYRVSNVSAGQSLLESASSGLNVLIIFLLIMATLAAIVGSIGLTGTLTMNVMDRTREFAVMRAIGASDGEVMRLVIVEGLVIGLISWALGSLLAFPISTLLWNVISKSLFDSVSAFTFNITGFVLWMVVEMLLAVVASIVPARGAARLTIREALAYE
ncbi:MAG: ABC transporter permease [Anaerolineae bacterium]|nr:ABC transporter permease [Anaerolineae bacterium]